MKSQKPKTKNDASHYGRAMSACGFFEVQATSKQEKTRMKKGFGNPFRKKLKYALNILHLICFNTLVNQLKKIP